MLLQRNVSLSSLDPGAEFPGSVYPRNNFYRPYSLQELVHRLYCTTQQHWWSQSPSSTPSLSCIALVPAGPKLRTNVEVHYQLVYYMSSTLNQLSGWRHYGRDSSDRRISLDVENGSFRTQPPSDIPKVLLRVLAQANDPRYQIFTSRRKCRVFPTVCKTSHLKECGDLGNGPLTGQDRTKNIRGAWHKPHARAREILPAFPGLNLHKWHTEICQM